MALTFEPIAPSSPDIDGREDSRWRRALRGRAVDPAWVRPALLSLLIGTALLYLVGLGASGWANSFYSAAVEAGAKNWKAFFFGSFDSSSFITVDKPPASLWVMELSARLFGVNSWSILVPQALEGVGAVGLLYATVRRRWGAAAGLVAGTVLATTPVATLMFRFNNPDALLVLLLVAAAYAVTRALESASTRWLLLAGAFVGFGFITKMLQAFVVLPGFGAVYLVYARTSLRRRVGQLIAAGLAVVGSAGWWVAAVELTPASARPYVGGSTTDSVLQLAFGYNGLGRLTGNETGSVGGGGFGTMWGTTGITRLFSSDFGGQISWLIPAALVLGAATFWAVRGRDPVAAAQRSQVWLWASWLVITGAVFSFSKGIIHPYYSVALAPAIGALTGIGAVTLWRLRERLWSRVVLAGTLTMTVAWTNHLMLRSASWHPSLRATILVVGLLAAAAMLLPPVMTARPARASAVLAGVGLLAALAAPAAYSLQTAAATHTGAIPSAGPSGAGGGFGGGGPGGRPGRPPALGGQAPSAAAGQPTASDGMPAGGLMPPLGGGPGGGLLNAGSVSRALTTALETNAASYTWVAATVGAENASGYQLAAREPIMAIGGFNGTDNSPSLAQFKAYVAAGKIHYFIAGGGGPGMAGGGAGGSISSSSITQWVAANFSATTIGGQTVYDLTT
ncbi:MAG: glycosyltransferase family 39 protein [Frankiaceae bacterium]|nr:glycosyltransferase family 39 protein [Frankiaceae bacterium]